jgi:hypothetical protein
VRLIPLIQGMKSFRIWDLAPRNARGMVEYATSVETLKPKDLAHSNRVLLFDVANRGNQIALAF